MKPHILLATNLWILPSLNLHSRIRRSPPTLAFPNRNTAIHFNLLRRPAILSPNFKVCLLLNFLLHFIYECARVILMRIAVDWLGCGSGEI